MTIPCFIRKPAPLAALAALLGPGLTLADDEPGKNDPAEGHSVHGEVFNAGPRQAAQLIPGTGDLSFAVTTKSPEAQRFFNQGIGQLHGFWYFESERSFRQAAALDPECAMAYWGMAMSNFDNAKRGPEFASEAKKRREKAGERERLYIDGLAAYFANPKADKKGRLRGLIRSYEGIIEKHPDDIEAKAFLAWTLFTSNSSGIEYQSYYATNLLLGEILAKDPDHPVHHYRIHLWDGEKPANAVQSAAQCGPAAPGIAHMWHMPGHTYSKLQRYSDAAWQQEASARVDHAHMIRYRVIPDQIHNFAHNNEWLIRNLNHLGRADAALDLARNMVELPRLPRFGGKDNKEYQAGGSWQFGRQRLRDTLLRFEQWDEMIRLADTQYLKPDPKTLPELEWHRFLGIAKYEKGDLPGAKTHLDKVEALLKEETGKRDKAIADAEKKARDGEKDAKQIEESKKAAEKNFSNAVQDRENAANELRVYAALNAQPMDKAKALEFLPKLKNLAKARHAHLWSRAGELGKAQELADQGVKEGVNETHPLAVQVGVLHAAGKKQEARTAFDKLRTVAGTADFDLPMLRRLAPVAKEFGYPEDWRTPAPAAKDLGKRPPLDDLGPYRWSPPVAPSWTLKDASGREVSLSGFEGKPVLAVFYLGKGCVHCMEQLNNFVPVTDAYKKAGISIVAISTDTPAGLAETFQKAAAEGEKARNPFPFPLLSDASQDTFKSYRAHDDFEKQPLHGTYLIDGKGRIRWQDISYEPFMQTEWLLEECQRLLSLGES